jgi:hypothetical protein
MAIIGGGALVKEVTDALAAAGKRTGACGIAKFKCTG